MLTPEALLFALGIFLLRVANNAIGTLRVVIITRQQRIVAAVMGFFEALIFAITMGAVVVDLTNILNLMAYCGGFAVGSYVGMAIEARFITSYMTVNIITKTLGHEIAQALRAAGFGATETSGEGRDGLVTIIRSVIVKKEVPRMLDIVRETQPEAFVSVDEARSVHRGWVRVHRVQQ